ncbi:MAG: stage III sporulation protein AE [Peptococcaceae bacterium]|jgi:stage III sporulation protein AE|nr:stage III sporulation protein AE [Peptococcaceae bacterium]MDH7525351.1 stage III sporulation protein AE [Peptococcaceae bacterium]
MRRLPGVVILLLFFTLPAGAAAAGFPMNQAERKPAQSLEAAVEKQKKALDLRELEEFICQVDREVGSYLPELSLSKMIDSFKKGEFSFSPQEVVSKIIKLFVFELTANLTLLGKLLIIAVVCSILINLQSAFEGGTVARLACFVCLAALITIALGSFNLAVKTGLGSISKMVGFMKLLLPVLLVLLTAVGGLTSTALLQPFLMVFLSVMGVFIQGVIFPLIYLTAMISIVNSISDRFKVTRIASLIRQLAKAGIGLVLTLFIGVVTVQGAAGAVIDGVTLRTAKFMTGAFVPVAGSMFADALDAVMGGSLLLKNAVGLTGVLVLGAIALFPVIKILAIAVIYRLAAALLQPLGDTLVADALEDMAGSLFLVFAAVASVAIMFFMTIAVIVGTANFTVMLR